MTPFTLAIPESDLVALRDRLTATRFPDPLPGHGWDRGVPVDYLRRICSYWADKFDWRAQERKLNAYPQYTTEIDGQVVHFLHVRSPEPDALPLVLTHGYPSSVAEFLALIGPLSDPRAHGGDPADAFHLVIPSLPGYGCSVPLSDTGWEVSRTGRAWAELMRRLGYERYGAHGGDIGAGVAGELGRLGRALGVHTATDTRVIAFFAADDHPGLTDADRARLAELRAGNDDDAGYIKIQSTRPQTVGYGLVDSPAAQLAWIIEKYRAWTDATKELPEDAVDLDQLLTTVSLYWFHRTGASAAAFLYEAFHAVQDWAAPGAAPVGMACFAAEPLARKLIDPDGELAHWTEHERGDHFPAMEVPDLLVDDLRAFFRPLR